ncbi:hypothetical protein HD554DRAFT_2079578 [Boletus coccyginus]|nr:hypothetical protein HD554DRAFT_2079578 [Boletus coccyginus]
MLLWQASRRAETGGVLTYLSTVQKRCVVPLVCAYIILTCVFRPLAPLIARVVYVVAAVFLTISSPLSLGAAFAWAWAHVPANRSNHSRRGEKTKPVLFAELRDTERHCSRGRGGRRPNGMIHD